MPVRPEGKDGAPHDDSRHVAGRRSALGFLHVRRRATAALRHARPDGPTWQHARPDGPTWQHARPDAPRRRRRAGLYALAAGTAVVLAIALLTPRPGDDPGTERVAGPPAVTSPPPAATPAGTPAATPDATEPTPARVRPAGTGAVRARTEQVLGQHAVLTARLGRALVRGDADLAEAASSALGRNVEDMSSLVAALYDEDAARGLGPLWARGVAALSAAASAAADDDAPALARATAEFTEASAALGLFFEELTAGAVSGQELQARLREHADGFVEHVRAYAATDYATAYRLAREGYAQMFPLGRTLAAGLAAGDPALAADADTPERQLQSRLGMLLGERAQLAVDTMRSGLAGWPDFPAAAAALDANSRDLASAVGGVFGTSAEQQFAAAWADEVDALAAYTRAVAADDEAGKQAAKRSMQSADTTMGKLLGTWTQGRLQSKSLVPALAGHTAMLVEQIDAYDARDYRAAQVTSVEAFRDVFALAGTTAEGFGATVAARVPRGGAQTGLGGMAARVGGS